MSEASPIQSALSDRFPNIVERMNARGRAAADLETLENLRSRSDDWDALVERWLEGIELNSDTVYALSGFGDGRHVAGLLARLPPNAYVFCAEPDPAALAGSALDADLVEIVSDERLFIGAGTLDDAFFESMEEFPAIEISDARPLVFAPLYNTEPDYFARFFADFPRALDYWRRLQGTGTTASGKWQSNAFANAGDLIDAPDLSETAGFFKDSTIILAAAGPSLDDSLDFIEANRRNCLVVALNSSYRALRNRGIKPHFVIAADPYEWTAKGFRGVSCSDTILICPFIVYPEVVKLFEGRALTWSQNSLLASYLRLTSGKTMGSEVTELGTVSACIFDIAKIFGSRAIVFAGQDLAARHDGKMHASDSFYSDNDRDWLKSDDYRILPGNAGEDVKVEGKLHVYLKGLESLAAVHGNDLELHNLSRNGARIEGIPYTAPEDLSGLLNRTPSHAIVHGMNRVRKVLKKGVNSRKQMRRSIEGLAEFGKSACSLALAEALRLELGLRNQSNALRAAIEKATEGEQALQKFRDDHADPSKILDDGALKYHMALYKKAKQRIQDEPDEDRRQAQLLLEYYWAVAEGSLEFSRSAEEALAGSR